MLHQLQHNSSVFLGHSWHNEELRYKGQLYLCKQSQLKSIVLSEIHASSTTEHSGFTKTYESINRSFFWNGMKLDIHTFVVECEVCQCNKGETFKASGTLQLLLIPLSIWRDISMDFIVGLPKSGNNLAIMVVVDRLCKYDHFCALQHPFTTSTMVQIIMDNIFKLHGMPNSIVSDRDPTFTNNFWKELFKLHGTQFHLSTTYLIHKHRHQERMEGKLGAWE
jgi:hypothetical protein